MQNSIQYCTRIAHGKIKMPEKSMDIGLLISGSTPAASTILEALNSQWIQGFSLYSCGFPRIPQFTFAFGSCAVAEHFLRRIAHGTAHGDHHRQTIKKTSRDDILAGFFFIRTARPGR